MTNSSDWASLPRDLIDMILDKIIELPDFIRFSSVNKPWRSIALESNPNSHPQSHRLLWHHHNILETCQNELPVLFTPTKDDEDNKVTIYSVTQEASYDFQLPISYSGRFIGSSYGWLFMVDKNMIITLINPFLNKSFTLPKLILKYCIAYRLQVYDRDDHDLFIRKAILLSPYDPGQNNHPNVFLIYSLSGDGRLAYLDYDTDEGTKEWKSVVFSNHRLEGINTFSDIICYKGLVYTVTHLGTLVLVDTSRGYGFCKTIAKDGYDHEFWDLKLVESQNGDLLLVRRKESIEKPTISKIIVSKLSYCSIGDCMIWEEIKSIGEEAVFLGDNTAISVSTIDFPKCKPNCVYYVDQYFNIHDGYIALNQWNEHPIKQGWSYAGLGLYGAELRYKELFDTPSHTIWVVPNLKS